MQKKNKYKYSFDELRFKNRWKEPIYSRSGTWTIIGIHQHWFSFDQYDIRLCFFGFEIIVWMKRESVERSK